MQMRCPEARAFVLSGNKDVTRHLCMRAARRIPLTVGGTDCRLIEYRVSIPNSSSNAPCHLPPESMAAFVSWACDEPR